MNQTTINPQTIESLLTGFCPPEDSARAALLGVHNTGEVLVATNGHILAEIRIEEYPTLKQLGSDRSELGFPGYESLIPEYETDTPLSVAPDDLKTPLDKFSSNTSEECDRCHGKGSTTHTCNCEYCYEDTDEECYKCGGEGVLTEDIYQVVRINKKYYQAQYMNQLADLMDAFHIETAPMQYDKKDYMSLCLLSGRGLRLLIIPCFKPDNHDAAEVIHEIDL